MKTTAMTAEERVRYMTQAPVRRLILEMSAPTVISMLVTSFYNMADGVASVGGGRRAAGIVFDPGRLYPAKSFRAIPHNSKCRYGCRYGGEIRFSPPAPPCLQFLISHSSFLIKIVPPSYLPTFSLRPDFALFFCPFAQEKDSHSMEKALLSFRQQGNFYNVLFSDLCRITGGSNAVRCSS